MADEIKVDLKAIRNEGYSDEELARDLAKKNNFDYDEAIKEGYHPKELIKHFTGQEALPEGKVTVETTPLQAAEIAGPAAAVAKQSFNVAAKPVTKAIDILTNKLGDKMYPNIGKDPGSLQRYFNTQVGHGVNLPIEKAEEILGLKPGSLFNPSLLQDASKQLKEMHLAGDLDLANFTDGSKGGKSLSQMGAELKLGLPAFGKSLVQKSLPYVSIGTTAADVQDLMNRLGKDDYTGAAISGLGLLGSGISYIPHPLTRTAGLALGVGAPLVNAYLDKRTEEKEPKKHASGGPLSNLK